MMSWQVKATSKPKISTSAGCASPAVELVGIHAHIGSQVFRSESFAEAVRLTEGHSAADPVVSPDGKWVAYVTRDHGDEADSDYEVALAPMSGDGEARLLTQNGLDDHYPMFTGDSKRVVFKTKYPIERTTWTLTTGRSLPVE